MQSYIKKCYTQSKNKKNHDKNRDFYKIFIFVDLSRLELELSG